MRRAYVAGPYRADTEHGVLSNIRAAEAVGIELRRMGYAAFVPHANSAHQGGVVPDAHFLAEGLSWLSVADVLVALPRWRESKGTCEEVQFAARHGKRVYYWPEDREALRQDAHAEHPHQTPKAPPASMPEALVSVCPGCGD